MLIDGHESLSAFGLARHVRDFIEGSNDARQSLISSEHAQACAGTLPRDLFHHLYAADDQIDAELLLCTGYSGILGNDASPTLLRSASALGASKIRHLVVRVGSLVIDLCYRRLGEGYSSLYNFPDRELRLKFHEVQNVTKRINSGLSLSSSFDSESAALTISASRGQWLRYTGARGVRAVLGGKTMSITAGTVFKFEGQRAFTVELKTGEKGRVEGSVVERLVANSTLSRTRVPPPKPPVQATPPRPTTVPQDKAHEFDPANYRWLKYAAPRRVTVKNNRGTAVGILAAGDVYGIRKISDKVSALLFMSNASKAHKLDGMSAASLEARGKLFRGKVKLEGAPSNVPKTSAVTTPQPRGEKAHGIDVNNPDLFTWHKFRLKQYMIQGENEAGVQQNVPVAKDTVFGISRKPYARGRRLVRFTAGNVVSLVVALDVAQVLSLKSNAYNGELSLNTRTRAISPKVNAPDRAAASSERARLETKIGLSWNSPLGKRTIAGLTSDGKNYTVRLERSNRLSLIGIDNIDGTIIADNDAYRESKTVDHEEERRISDDVANADDLYGFEETLNASSKRRISLELNQRITYRGQRRTVKELVRDLIVNKGWTIEQTGRRRSITDGRGSRLDGNVLKVSGLDLAEFLYSELEGGKEPTHTEAHQPVVKTFRVEDSRTDTGHPDDEDDLLSDNDHIPDDLDFDELEVDDATDLIDDLRGFNDDSW